MFENINIIGIALVPFLLFFVAITISRLCFNKADSNRIISIIGKDFIMPLSLALCGILILFTL